jgi:hypothetical protein
MFLICIEISWSHNQCHEFWYFNLGQIRLVFFSFQEVILFPWPESQIIQHRFFFIGLSLFHDLSHGLTCWSSWPNSFFLLLLLIFFFSILSFNIVFHRKLCFISGVYGLIWSDLGPKNQPDQSLFFLKNLTWTESKADSNRTGSAWFVSFFYLKTGKPDKSFKMTCFSCRPTPLGLLVILSSPVGQAFN